MLSIINKFLSFFILCMLIQSCLGPSSEINCREYFLKARKIVNTSNSQNLDSALYFINQSLKCENDKIPAVDLKVYILRALGRYDEGMRFIDSQSLGNFQYEYKKQLFSDNFRSFTLDSISRQILCKEMDSYLTAYITNHNLSDTEEEQAYFDLFAIKERYMNRQAISSQIDSLIDSKPEKKKFFEFLRN